MSRLMRVFLMFSIAAVMLYPAPLPATEGGGNAYPNGAEDFLAGALPPPGTYFLNYMLYYNAPRLKDNNGDNVPIDFHLRAFAEVARILHVTDKKILGANWAMHVFIPYKYLDATAGPAGMAPSDNKHGLGDIIIDPIILGWHKGNLHFAAGLDIYMPTGAYNSGRLVNPGRNYWTFEPIFAVTYLSDGGFDISAKFMYDFNTENNDTDYLSGQEFHFDYMVGQRFGPVSAGIGGYFYQQTTDDEKNGATVPDNKGRVFAIGPALKYDYKKMSFTLKYQHELEARNRPEGDAAWFKFSYVF